MTNVGRLKSWPTCNELAFKWLLRKEQLKWTNSDGFKAFVKEALLTPNEAQGKDISNF